MDVVIAKTRRQFVPHRPEALEGRVVLSSFGHPALTPPPVVVSHMVHETQAMSQVHRNGAHATAQLAKHASHHPGQATATPTVWRWSWLANTYWYVPPTNLPATLYNSSTGTLAAVSDQTVFHITGYRNGYFWGKVVTQLGSSSPSGSSMVGSVTPQGSVLLSFTQASSSQSPAITQGYGKIQRKFGQWTMENQMFTSPSETLQIGHWAYMVQTRPGLPSWNSLPSAGVSVPEFLSEGNSSAPQPIGP